jgi:IclR family acetate operon transcriptional repressor
MEEGSDHSVLAGVRLLDILELFEARQTPLTLQEIATGIGVSKSSTFRLLFTLRERGYLDTNENTKTYWPSPRIYNIGRIAVLHNTLRQPALTIVEELHRRFDVQVLFSVLTRGRVLVLDAVKPSNMARLRATIGISFTPHSTAAGKAILAFLPEAQLDEVIARVGLPKLTRRTLSTPAELKADLEATRRRGFAINDGEQEENLYAIAVPIFNEEPSVVASLCISGSHLEIATKEPRLITQALLEAGLELSRRLGYTTITSEHHFFQSPGLVSQQNILDSRALIRSEFFDALRHNAEGAPYRAMSLDGEAT